MAVGKLLQWLILSLQKEQHLCPVSGLNFFIKLQLPAIDECFFSPNFFFASEFKATLTVIFQSGISGLCSSQLLTFVLLS